MIALFIISGALLGFSIYTILFRTTKLPEAVILIILGVLLSSASFLFSVYAKAEITQVSELSMEYKNFAKGSHNPLITDNGLNHLMGQELNLRMNLEFLDCLYWRNMVHSYTDRQENGTRGQYRLIGWNYALGIRPFQWVELGYEHFSQHLLDATFPFRNPEENSLGIKLFFITPTVRGSIW